MESHDSEFSRVCEQQARRFLAQQGAAAGVDYVALMAEEAQRRREARESVRADKIARRVAGWQAARPAVFAGDWPLRVECADWARALAAGDLDGRLNLWLVGNIGNAKTWSAWAVIGEALQAGWAGGWQFVKSARFWEIAAPPADFAGLRALREVDLLVLDDVGSVRLSAWDQDRLGDLVDERAEQQRPTILTTNIRQLGPDPDKPAGPDNTGLLGGRAASRLVGGGIVPVRFDGPDYRREGPA